MWETGLLAIGLIQFCKDFGVLLSILSSLWGGFGGELFSRTESVTLEGFCGADFGGSFVERFRTNGNIRLEDQLLGTNVWLRVNGRQLIYGDIIASSGAYLGWCRRRSFRSLITRVRKVKIGSSTINLSSEVRRRPYFTYRMNIICHTSSLFPVTTVFN